MLLKSKDMELCQKMPSEYLILHSLSMGGGSWFGAQNQIEDAHNLGCVDY